MKWLKRHKFLTVFFSVIIVSGTLDTLGIIDGWGIYQLMGFLFTFWVFIKFLKWVFPGRKKETK